MSRRLVFVAAATGLVALFLGGCAPVADLGSTPALSETATPLPEPQGDPQPTLPVACSELFTEAEASAILQYDVTLKVDEKTVYRPNEIGSHQVGMTSCAWGGETKTDNSWDQNIQLDILPDADADWQTGVWQADDGAIVYPEGSTTSEYLCSLVVDDYSQCAANVLVDGYWAHVQSQSVGPNDGRTQQTADKSMRDALDLLATRIAASGDPRPEWVEPEGVLQGKYCTDTPSVSPGFPASVAVARAGAVSCNAIDGWSATIQPGGAWAVPLFVGQPVSWSTKDAQLLTVTGSDNAVWSCGDGCYGLFAVNGSAVTLYSSDIVDEATFTAKAGDILAAVVEAG